MKLLTIALPWALLFALSCQKRVEEPLRVEPPRSPTEIGGHDAGLRTPSSSEGSAASSLAPKVATPTNPSRCIVPMGESGPVPPKASQCPSDPTPKGSLAKASVRFPEAGGRTISVELARTPDETEKGLMYRREMGDDEGMLFMLPSREEHSFWMKNTCIPLDMMFIDEDGLIVGIVENVPTLNLVGRGVPCLSRFVLEVNAGYSRRNGVRPGQRVILPQ